MKHREDHFFQGICICPCPDCTVKTGQMIKCTCPDCPKAKCGLKTAKVMK